MSEPAAVVAARLVRSAVALAGVDAPVVVNVPANRPPHYVQVVVLGAREQSVVARVVSIAVRVVAESDQKAALAAEALVDCMGRAVLDEPEVFYWDTGEYPVAWPDPDIPKLKQWQFTGTFNYIPE